VKTNQLGPVSPPVSFRHFLRGELALRCGRNAQYSLRAFARFLGLDHSTLSQLLRGKRRLTERTVRRCGMRLGLDEDSVREFCRSEAGVSDADDEVLGEVRRLASDTASVVAEWHHYAILELVRLDSFRPDSRWLARVLGLSVDEVNIALQRLLRLGLLSMDAADRWVDRSGDTAASVRGFTGEALRRLVEQSGARLLEAIENPASGQCAYSATTIAIPSDRITEVAERIERFRRELLAFARKNARPDDVYQLEIRFVPLTRLNPEESPDGTARDSVADRDQTA
jgi:transcriptional regulator with XRE-family HTH domain